MSSNSAAKAMVGKKTSKSTALSEQSERKYQKKLRDLKRRIRDAETENDRLLVKLSRTRKNTYRLRLERRFLFDKLQELEGDGGEGGSPFKASISDDSSDDDLGLAIGSATAQKRSKKERADPNAPKRPPNAFFMYCQDERRRRKAENPHLSKQEITGLLVASWKEMSTEEKAQYYDMYKNDKQRYNKQMASYQQKGTLTPLTDTTALPTTTGSQGDLNATGSAADGNTQAVAPTATAAAATTTTATESANVTDPAMDIDTITQ